MAFNPAMVTLAREARQWSQSQLARETGLQQGTISKIEGGLLTPPADTLNELARVLDVPASLFDQRMDYRQLPISFFRKGHKVSAYHLKAIRARTNFTRMEVRTLLSAVNVPTLRIVRGDNKGGVGAAANAARLLRVHWNLPPGPIRNLTEAVENAGIVVVPMDFGDAKVDGLSLYDPADDLPPLIFYNPRLSWDRARFTIAHEVGHIVLHHHLSIAETERDYEAEAHFFAGELLTPAAEVKSHLSGLTLQKLAAYKAHWRVSMQSLIMRAHQIGRITDRQKSYLFMQMGKLGYRTREPVELSPEPPTLLSEMVGYYLDDLGYSEQKLSADLHMQAFQFRRKYRSFDSAAA